MGDQVKVKWSVEVLWAVLFFSTWKLIFHSTNVSWTLCCIFQVIDFFSSLMSGIKNQIQMYRKWGIHSQITISNACCNSRPWHGTFADSGASSWLLMTWSSTYPLHFPASWKLQEASVHPQGCLHWEIDSKSSSPLSEWTDAFSLFPPFPYQAPWEPVMAPSLLLSLRSYQCCHNWFGHYCKGKL